MPDTRPEAPKSTRRKVPQGRWEVDTVKRAVTDGIMTIVLGLLLIAVGDHLAGNAFEHGSKRDSGFFFFVLLLGGFSFGWGVVRLANARRMVGRRRQRRLGHPKRPIDPETFD